MVTLFVAILVFVLFFLLALSGSSFSSSSSTKCFQKRSALYFALPFVRDSNFFGIAKALFHPKNRLTHPWKNDYCADVLPKSCSVAVVIIARSAFVGLLKTNNSMYLP